jgi:hypothetical protein
MRLVEVVDVEDQFALRRPEESEVGQVRVAAELHLELSAREHAQIGRHDRGTAPVEGEGALEHPTVPLRDQLLQAARDLCLEDRDRVLAIGSR